MNSAMPPFNPYIAEVNFSVDPSSVLAGFETYAEAKAWNDVNIATLSAGRSRADQELASILSSCHRRRPCLSGACRVCMREMRRWFASATASLFNELSWEPGEGFAVTIVPGARWQPNHMNPGAVRAFKERVRELLDGAGLGDEVAIGGVDLSWNTSDGEREGHVRPHAYLLFPTLGSERHLKAALKARLLATPDTPRPIRFRPLVNQVEASTYAMKAVLTR
ncbi:MAG: hypothetical protein AB7P20_15720, partial [Rhizobiaceae bacterium]